MDMGERIKSRRVEMGLTQEELAGRLGLQKSAIAKYENGRVENIKRSIIQKMAAVLDCSPCFLMGFDDAPAAPALSLDELEMVREFRALPPECQQTIRSNIRFLLAENAKKGESISAG